MASAMIQRLLVLFGFRRATLTGYERTAIRYELPAVLSAVARMERESLRAESHGLKVAFYEHAEIHKLADRCDKIRLLLGYDLEPAIQPSRRRKRK